MTDGDSVETKGVASAKLADVDVWCLHQRQKHVLVLVTCTPAGCGCFATTATSAAAAAAAATILVQYGASPLLESNAARHAFL